MTILGFDKPLYILPFDHRGSFQKKMFGWDGALSAQQTAALAAFFRKAARKLFLRNNRSRNGNKHGETSLRR